MASAPTAPVACFAASRRPVPAPATAASRLPPEHAPPRRLPYSAGMSESPHDSPAGWAARWVPDGLPPDGQRAAFHRIAAAVRRMNELLVDSDMPEAGLIAAAEAAEALARRFEDGPRNRPHFGFGETDFPVEKRAEDLGDLLNKLLAMTKEDVQNGLENGVGPFLGGAYHQMAAPAFNYDKLLKGIKKAIDPNFISNPPHNIDPNG